MNAVTVEGEPLEPGKDGERTQRIVDEGETMLVVSVSRTFVVRCGVCSAKFPGWDRECPTQASECAASYRDGKIHGHYGSTVADMLEIDVDMDVRASLPERVDPVCDRCIQGWLDAGKARIVGEVQLGYYPGDPATVTPFPTGSA